MICTISYSSSEESETSETSESEEEPLRIYMMEEGPQDAYGDQSLTAAMFQKIQKSQKHKQYPSLKDHVEDSLSEQFKEKCTVSPKKNLPAQLKKAKGFAKQKQSIEVTSTLQIHATDKGISQKSKDKELGPQDDKITSGHKRSLLRKKCKKTKEVIWSKRKQENPQGVKPITRSQQQGANRRSYPETHHYRR
ncbi:hypothetical protein HanPI659440_Chr05g0211491 [Helianthus annuus]|nr:hypothetical protein HanPI659440_Chr05g0211491 [Helianthus annuus]